MITPTIDRDIPPPKPRLSYPCAEMQVGDSFAVPIEAIEAVNTGVWRFQKRNEGFRFTLRSEPENGIVRVWRIAAIIAAVMLATPAYAWTDAGNVNATASGGTASASQHQSQQSVARSNANASTGPVRATGGTVNNSVVAGGGTYRQAPDVVVPSIGGGGADCPTVGFGAGGAGLGGGGGFGPSWISSDCNKRKVAAELAQIYGPAVARAYMEREIPGVREAVAATTRNEHTEYPYDWCWTRDAGNTRQRLVCEGK